MQGQGEMEGVVAGDEALQTQPPLLAEEEKRVLELYDKSEELQLEIALLKTQNLSPYDISAAVTDEDLARARDELLKVKAVYQVRCNVIKNVLVANPIVRAVHAGQNATAVEQDLLPLLQERDNLSLRLTTLSSKVLETKDKLSHAQIDNTVISTKNGELAKIMLTLADQANIQWKEDIGDSKLRQEYDDLEADMKVSRQKWRIMKGTASATIAGSGVDWACDPNLLQIVLDEE